MRELVSTYPDVIRNDIDRNRVVILRIRHISRQRTNP
jgi:hypothetical protein